MTTKPDGGHAYPTNAYRYDEHGNVIPIVGPGMTLRDRIAIAAMQSMLSYDEYREGRWPDHAVARCAYNMAEAMLKEREKRG